MLEQQKFINDLGKAYFCGTSFKFSFISDGEWVTKLVKINKLNSNDSGDTFIECTDGDTPYYITFCNPRISSIVRKGHKVYKIGKAQTFSFPIENEEEAPSFTYKSMENFLWLCESNLLIGIYGPGAEQPKKEQLIKDITTADERKAILQSLTKEFGELTIAGFWAYNEDTIAVNCITSA